MAGPLELFTRVLRRGRRPAAPHRDTLTYPQMSQLGSPRDDKKRPAFKPIARNLRYFSKTTFARRAINAVKNPIANQPWEIVPKKGVKSNAELDRQIEAATYCFEHPNYDDSFSTLAEAVIEDVLCGAGAIEIQIGADELRPLWMWGVDGLSIQMFAGWDGDPRDARYYQTQGYGGLGNLNNNGIPLRNDELIYIKPNPTTANPFGTGPLEVAFLSVARQLGVADFAGNVSSNAKPASALQIKGADADTIYAFRQYWQNEIEAQGKMPILGGEDAQVLRFWPEGDSALYLQYQQWLVREIATAFDLSPQNFGVEADVNRNTAEVAEDRDWDAAIKPMARKFSAHLTREALHAKLGFYQLEHKFIGLDRSDEKATAEIFAIYYDRNAITPNEHRDKLGMEPSTSQWADLTSADVKIATEAARSMAVDLDKDLPAPSAAPSPTPAANRAAKPRSRQETT